MSSLFLIRLNLPCSFNGLIHRIVVTVDEHNVRKKKELGIKSDVPLKKYWSTDRPSLNLDQILNKTGYTTMFDQRRFR